jgi:WD40 repeat protein
MRYRVPRPQVVCRMRCPRLLLGMLCCCLPVLLAACGSSAGAQGTPTNTPQPTATATPAGPTLTTAQLTYTGHGKAVIGAAWSPDGKRIASCGVDGSVQVWDAHNGKTLWKSTVASFAFACAWSPDGQRIAAGGTQGTLVILDAATGNQAASLSGQSGAIEGVAWSPDGKHIVSGSQDHTAVVWDAHSGTSLLTYTGHSDSVERVAWSPDGKRIASASYDQTVQVWDAQSGKTLLTYKGHQAPVWAVAWSPDGKRIASGTGAAGIHGPVTSDNSVQVWDAQSGKTLLTVADASGQSYAVAWSPDGKRIASGDGQSVRVWEATTGQAQLTYRGHSSDIFQVAWSPDGSLIASASDDGTVQVWRPQA